MVRIGREVLARAISSRTSDDTSLFEGRGLNGVNKFFVTLIRLNDSNNVRGVYFSKLSGIKKFVCGGVESEYRVFVTPQVVRKLRESD